MSVKLFCTLSLENNCPFAVSASALVLCWWIGQMQGGVETPDASIAMEHHLNLLLFEK
jgi:hypothetical protein